MNALKLMKKVKVINTTLADVNDVDFISIICTMIDSREIKGMTPVDVAETIYKQVKLVNETLGPMDKLH